MTPDSAAAALALAEGREVRSIKDLLCDACGVAVALRAGLCIACDADVANHYDAKRAAEGLDAFPAEEPDGFAAHCAAAYDDPEGAAMLAGLNPGKL